MQIARRDFLRRSVAFSAGFAGLHRFLGRAGGATPATAGYGPLRPDPRGFIDLPEGFSYTLLSPKGAELGDGLITPGKHDGMAAFAGPEGRVVLVRNHELEETWLDKGPFGAGNERLGKVDRGLMFDPGLKGACALGGTSTLVFNPRTGALEHAAMSLLGTSRNCAGGPTPWGSWLTCEETTLGRKNGLDVDHGWVFEVPSAARTPVKPEPLRAMGRFRHEAVAIHPGCGCAYLTEDLADGLLYRFLPHEPGRLAAGGKLQALAVRDRDALDTKNWGEGRIAAGTSLATRWVEIGNVESPEDDLRLQGASKGAARFARCEGIWWGEGRAYFAATTGGKKQLGQVWVYEPSAEEGRPGEDASPGRLSLLLEPNDSSVLNNADNISAAPWGDLVVCEDGAGHNGLVGVTPGGEAYRIARVTSSESETAGVCFSPDGAVMFFNVQNPGVTVAVRGPWRA